MERAAARHGRRSPARAGRVSARRWQDLAAVRAPGLRGQAGRLGVCRRAAVCAGLDVPAAGRCEERHRSGQGRSRGRRGVEEVPQGRPDHRRTRTRQGRHPRLVHPRSGAGQRQGDNSRRGPSLPRQSGRLQGRSTAHGSGNTRQRARCRGALDRQGRLHPDREPGARGRQGHGRRQQNATRPPCTGRPARGQAAASRGIHHGEVAGRPQQGRTGGDQLPGFELPENRTRPAQERHQGHAGRTPHDPGGAGATAVRCRLRFGSGPQARHFGVHHGHARRRHQGARFPGNRPPGRTPRRHHHDRIGPGQLGGPPRCAQLADNLRVCADSGWPPSPRKRPSRPASPCAPCRP